MSDKMEEEIEMSVEALHQEGSGHVLPKSAKIHPHKPAFLKTKEKDGELWLTHGFYATKVNFCPICGYSPSVPDNKLTEGVDNVREMYEEGVEVPDWRSGRYDDQAISVIYLKDERNLVAGSGRGSSLSVVKNLIAFCPLSGWNPRGNDPYFS